MLQQRLIIIQEKAAGSQNEYFESVWDGRQIPRRKKRIFPMTLYVS